KHRFANLGDGTYFHSGILAIRQSVAAKANVTYKVLYNGAVAMTGGQPIDGDLSPERLAWQLHAEGVIRIFLLSDKPEAYRRADLPPGTEVRHRDHMDPVMLELRDEPGTTAIVYDQMCAAEMRRKRSRGQMEDPDIRVHINAAVCEGCGDCSRQSNCVAVEPLETEFGRKRQINQSSCNKDLSCLKGFCPSFVTVRGGRLRKPSPASAPDDAGLPEPSPPGLDRPWNIAIAGVGGTGILTVGAVMAMAAHIEGKAPLVMDMAGLAQKGGAVLSHVRLSKADDPATAPRIANGAADVLLAADAVVAASAEAARLCLPETTRAVLDTRLAPVSDFVRLRDFDFQTSAIADAVAKVVRSRDHFRDFSGAAKALLGQEIAANMMLLGYAWQAGMIPLGREALTEAVRLNGVAVETNLAAFAWGRIMAHDPAAIETAIRTPAREPSVEEMSTADVIAHRRAHLVAYQDERLAARYDAAVAAVAAAADRLGSAAAKGRLIRAVALNYAKVLAYKDEYEVARLYADPAFAADLARRFEGDIRIAFNLAPPFLPGTTPDGRPRKREFGAGTLRLFRVLARFKRLRGTAFDVFGYSEDRRAERALIQAYEDDIAAVVAGLSEGNAGIAATLLEVPDEIRGFGPVKAEAMTAAARRRDELRSDFRAPQVGAAEAAE
ncbi:MAG TPA: indolepyruvate ferredoxin oxidoreductase family protein, partial [Methylomirabilota bacterium]|nr:indolepyruvate ferredoxin oxidoreductase family protein [Methylomirabilota bacterium]